MTKRPISRRDVLKGSAAAAAATVFAAPARAQLPAAGADQRRADRGGQEGRQGLLLHRDGPRFRAAARQGVRGEVSRHRGARSSAPAPSACSSASARSTRANIHAVDVANTADAAHCIIWKRNGWLAPYLPEEVAKHYDKAYYDPDGAQHRDAHPGVADRLQHQPGEEGRRAEELQGPARSEMGRQDGQGRIRPTAAPS